MYRKHVQSSVAFSVMKKQIPKEEKNEDFTRTHCHFYTARSHCMIYKLSARYEAVKKLPTIQAYKESILRV